MKHLLKIGGREFAIEWTQELARRYPFRASKIGGAPAIRDFTNPKKAAAAVTTFLWLLLPAAAHELFPSPEELYVGIDHETEAEAIHEAVFGVIRDMQPAAEKKRSSRKRPSRASSSG